MRTIDRREFLRTVALAGGAATLGSVAGWPRGIAQAVAPPIGGLPLSLPNPHNAPVDHVVVLMMENRSFDHYFGWLTSTNQQSYTDKRNPADQNPPVVDTYHLGANYRGCGKRDPDHSWNGGRNEVVNGFLSGGNDELALGYYHESDVEFYAKLARQFTLCDNYHCSLLGPTFPNREYMHSAQSGGIKDNRLPNAVPGQETGFTWPTIWDSLDQAGIPWAYYFVDLPAIGLWGRRLLHGARHIEDFFADAKAGTLPNVVFVDPGFTTGFRTDEHPHSDIRSGQAFSHNIVKAVVESPTWGRTAMFLNYDEWGGFFDHITSLPRTADSRATDGDPGGQDDFGQLGFRVPCLVMSPYSRKGVLGSERVSELLLPATTYFEHTSILNFIEWRFGLLALTARDAAASNIGVLLDFDQQPRLDAAEITELLPRPIVTSCPCRGNELEGTFQVGSTWSTVSGPSQDAVDGGAADAFQAAKDSGFFESVGYEPHEPKLHDILCGA